MEITARTHHGFSPGAQNGAAAPTLEVLRYMFSPQKSAKCIPEMFGNISRGSERREFQAPPPYTASSN
jgi:hypothetical protein